MPTCRLPRPALSGGALPNGLTLASGVISGTPTQAGSFSFTITATSGSCSGQHAYTLVVFSGNCAQVPLNLTGWWKAEGDANDFRNTNNGTMQLSATFAAGLIGQAFSFNGTNGCVKLPDNFFPFPASGAGTTPFTFETWFKTAAGGVILGQQSTAPYTTPGPHTPGIYVGTDGKLYSEVFWKGSVNQTVSAGTVNDNVYHHVAVVYTGTTQTTYMDGVSIGSKSHTQQGENVATYRYQLGTGYTTSWPSTPGGWYNFNGLIDEPALYSRALSASEVLSVVTAGSLGKYCTLAITTATLPNATIGAAYSQTIAATGGAGPITFSVTSSALPTGLTLSSAGVLSGTTTASGTFTFTVTTTDSSCPASQTYTVSVACQTITLGALPNGVVGARYNQTIAVSPAWTYSFSILSGSLPSGLTLNPSTGNLSGTPGTVGTYNFIVKAVAGNSCAGTQSYTLAIGCPTITLSDLPVPVINTAYNQTVTAQPAGSSYSFAVTAGALPAGSALNGFTGVISGTPTAAGAYSFTITATAKPIWRYSAQGAAMSAIGASS